MEFVRAGAANRAVVRRHRAEIQTQTVENRHVGVEHFVIAVLQAVRVFIEGVRVLHDEFAPAHHAKTRTNFVAEFGLNLIPVDRHLFVRLDFTSRHVGDDLFVRWADHEIALVAVFETQQFGAVLLPATGFLPQLGRLHRRHEQFNRARAIHFLAYDLLDFAHAAQPHRHQGVNAATDTFDHAGTDHELMADDFRFGGRFFERGDEKLTGFHDFLWKMGGSSIIVC